MTTRKAPKRNNRRIIWRREQLALRKLLGDSTNHMFYRRECLLPCLELQIVVKERSREELGDAVIVLMTLLKNGVRSIESLGKLTGLHRRTLEEMFVDMEGSSIVRRDAKGIRLTDIGEESLELGVPIRLIDRALRYCALTESLLPRDAYSLEFEPFSVMQSSFLMFKDILQESSALVDLRGLTLALSDAESKYEVNLPDEVVGVESIKGYQPAYMRAVLCTTGSSQPDKAWMIFGEALREYPLEAVKPLMDTFDPDSRQGSSSKSFGEIIEDSLRLSGVSLKSRLRIDEFGSPEVTIYDAPDEWLSSSLGMEDPWVLLCGTANKPARPVTRFPERDVLEGHTMSFYIDNRQLEADVELLRDFFELVETQYYTIPFREREYSVSDFVEENFSAADAERARSLVSRFNIRRAMNWFGARNPDSELV